MIAESDLNNPKFSDEEREMLRDQYNEEQEELREQQEWDALHPKPIPIPDFTPADSKNPSGKKRNFTIRFRVEGFNELTQIAAKKSFAIFGDNFAISVADVCRIALEEFIAREKKCR